MLSIYYFLIAQSHMRAIHIWFYWNLTLFMVFITCDICFSLKCTSSEYCFSVCTSSDIVYYLSVNILFRFSVSQQLKFDLCLATSDYICDLLLPILDILQHFSNSELIFYDYCFYQPNSVSSIPCVLIMRTKFLSN